MNRIKIIVVVLVYLLLAYFFLTKQCSNHRPSQLYKETRRRALKGIVTRGGCGKDFNIEINNIKEQFYFNARATVFETNENTQECLIAIGDSIFKKEFCDTFYVFRGNEYYIYVLP